MTTHAAALDTLRDRCERGWLSKAVGFNKDKESAAIMSLAGGGIQQNRKAAAIKTLRHLRLLNKFGAHDLWILSLPRKYTGWLLEEFDGISEAALESKLRNVREYHTKKEMRDLAAATQKANAWALKAMAWCAINPLGLGDALVKRWFADEDHESEEELKKIRKALAAGYARIASAATSGKLILSERPADRGTEWEESEAFVYKSEKLKVIYIEGDFFGNQNTLTGMTNWARIIVHELSHITEKTDDVETHGNPRYAWHPRGIAPMKGSFTTAQALNNADNWAWFAADAAMELSQKNRNDALVRPGIT